MMKKLAIILLIGSLGFVSADEAVNPLKPRECFSCQGINCQRTTKLNATMQCTDLLDICVTIFEDLTVVARGCYLDMPAALRSKCDERNNPECLKCFAKLCNNKGREDLKCIECNSLDNSKCSSDTSGMTPVQCPIPTAPNSYCYVRDDGKGAITRGCYAHVADQLDCSKAGTCSMCLPSDAEACNAFNLNGAKSAANKRYAIANLISIALLLLLLAVNLVH